VALLPPPKLTRRFLSTLGLTALALGGGAWLLARLVVEWQWFDQFGFQSVLLRRWCFQLLAFAAVLGIGSLLQLKQLQRCWRLRQGKAAKVLPPRPILRLESRGLVLTLISLMLLLAGGLSYLLMQARGLIGAPFSGEVITGVSVVKDLATPALLALIALLIPPLLIRPLTTLRIVLTAALAASATALARGWSLWLPALLATPYGEGDPLTGLDLSFTVLRLPAIHLLLSVAIAQIEVGLAACLLLT